MAANAAMNALRLGLRVASLREQGLCTCFCVLNLLRVSVACDSYKHSSLQARAQDRRELRVSCDRGKRAPRPYGGGELAKRALRKSLKFASAAMRP